MGWSYFPIGIVCPVISEEPKILLAALLLLSISLSVKAEKTEKEKKEEAKRQKKVDAVSTASQRRQARKERQAKRRAEKKQ